MPLARVAGAADRGPVRHAVHRSPAAATRVFAVSAATELRTRWRERTLLVAALVIAVALPLLLDLAIGRGAGADYRPRLGIVAPEGDAVAEIGRAHV